MFAVVASGLWLSVVWALNWLLWNVLSVLCAFGDGNLLLGVLNCVY